jgi:hypothetical protein
MSNKFNGDHQIINFQKDMQEIDLLLADLESSRFRPQKQSDEKRCLCIGQAAAAVAGWLLFSIGVIIVLHPIWYCMAPVAVGEVIEFLTLNDGIGGADIVESTLYIIWIEVGIFLSFFGLSLAWPNA